MKNRKAANALILVGGALMVSALLLFAHNQKEDEAAGEKASRVLSAVQHQMPIENRGDTVSPESHEETTAPSSVPAEMPEAEIDGYGYIGYLSIPALKLEVPIMSQWDDERLKIAPCRQCGSAYTDNLVIAGHNYRSHFGYFGSLELEDQIFFTDMDGVVHAYKIKKIEVLMPESVDQVVNSRWDLVLYTCTPDGQKRIVVGADRILDDLPQDSSSLFPAT